MLTRALGLAVLPLLATQHCDISMPPPPTHEESCLADYTTWGVSGLAPEQAPETPDQLLKAQLRVGDSVALHAATLGRPGECDDLVEDVAWRSSVPAVAEARSEGPFDGRLDALSPGESAVWADVTLQNGDVRRAELYAVPAGRTTRLRVYAVVVSR